MAVPGDPLVRPVGLRGSDDSGLVTSASPAPSLRWRLEARRDGVLQRAYEIQRCPDAGFAAGVIGTGRVEGAEPFGASWPGEPLASREVAWCRVRVWTDRGVTGWSEPLRVEGGLFERSDWIGRPISPAFNAGAVEPAPVPLFRRRFEVAETVVSARLFVTALGVHECWINGCAVAPDLFDPGWTAYTARHLYAAYDVTALLRMGENVIAAAVGDGWWRGNLTWMGKRGVYGDTTALLAQLELTHADGRREVIATDREWCGGAGGLCLADFYDGCTWDAALEPAGWREPGFDDGAWSPVVEQPLPARLEQRSAPAVREVRRFDVGFESNDRGGWSVDCGQNLTGWLRLTVQAPSGGVVTIRHAEVLEPDGQLHTAALRSARATDTYRLTPGAHVLAPSFTCHGFRHAEIALEGDLRLERVEACVVSSDLREIGHFACSDPLVTQLQSNIVWSQRGNFIALPTDCPQRDERLGWTGDIQVFAPTACANFDCGAFLSSWLADLAHEQASDGQVPSTVPNVIQGHPFEFGGVGWADAATLVPLALHEAYGDRAVLARQMPSMRAWVDWGASRLDAAGVWRGDFHLGDWLDPGAPPDRPEEATTDRDFIASAYLSFSAAAVARAARVLGEDAVAESYASLSARVAEATWRHWHDAAMRTQTGCAMAIAFGIAPADEIEPVGVRLAELIGQARGRIATGFLGTPLVLPALTAAGQHEASYRLLLNREAPGWLYQVRHGATTMWERWDAIEPDGHIHGGAMAAEDAASMTSFNHYAYGSVGAWLYRTLAGIAPGAERPGYGTIDFAPRPGGGIAWAEARIDTPHGPAAIRWDRRGEGLEVRLEIPPGTEGRFSPPPGWRAPVEGPLGSGVHRLALEPG